MFSVTCFVKVIFAFCLFFRTLHPFPPFHGWGGEALMAQKCGGRILTDEEAGHRAKRKVCENIYEIIYFVNVLQLYIQYTWWLFVDKLLKLEANFQLYFFCSQRACTKPGYPRYQDCDSNCCPAGAWDPWHQFRCKKNVWFGYPSRHVRHRILMAFQPRNVLKALSLEEKKDLRRLGKEISH